MVVLIRLGGLGKFVYLIGNFQNWLHDYDLSQPDSCRNSSAFLAKRKFFVIRFKESKFCQLQLTL